jgi:signal transduction histidine kinase
MTVRAALQRHPRWADGGFAALLAVANAFVADGRQDTALLVTDAVGWSLFAAMHLALVWRRSWPLGTAWTICGLAYLSLVSGTDGLFVPIVAMVAICAAVQRCPRRRSVPAAAAVESHFVVSWLVDDTPWVGLVALTFALTASVLLGVAISTRQAYLLEREERIRQLEHERDRQARLAAVSERARIARELHDIVTHNLAVMVALADAAAFTATVTPRRSAEAMTEVSSTGRQALGEMRRLLGLLRDDSFRYGDLGLRPQPGFADIDRLVAQVRAAGLTVTLVREGEPGPWGEGAGLTVYRIVQEALTNTLKHVGPTAKAHVRLRYSVTGVELEVVDDGVGHPCRPPAVGAGHGLVGMAERAAAYRGHVDAGPRSGEGWLVRARLRFAESEPAG